MKIVKEIREITTCRSCNYFDHKPRGSNHLTYVCVLQGKAIGTSESLRSEGKVRTRIDGQCPFRKNIIQDLLKTLPK